MYLSILPTPEAITIAAVAFIVVLSAIVLDTWLKNKNIP